MSGRASGQCQALRRTLGQAFMHSDSNRFEIAPPRRFRSVSIARLYCFNYGQMRIDPVTFEVVVAKLRNIEKIGARMRCPWSSNCRIQFA